MGGGSITLALAIWIPVLLLAVWAAHWGSEQLADPLKKLRSQWGFSAAAGGAFVGLASASPEIGINVTSAARGVSEIGLGAMLGSNVIAIPLMVATLYIATRKRKLEGDEGHDQHLSKHIAAVQREASTVQALPYLGVLAVFAAVTLPSPWRGLQPIDGWILLLTYLTFLVQALVRGRQDAEDVQWKRKELMTAAGGLAALAVGAFFTVFSTERIVGAIGIPQVIGGLFITAPVAALPEVFATRSVARSGQVTSAATSVIGDHAVTMTLAFIPLTIISTPIQDLRLFWVSLSFVALMPALYAAMLMFNRGETGFRRWHIAVLATAYAAFVATVLLWVQPFGQSSGGG